MGVKVKLFYDSGRPQDRIEKKPYFASIVFKDEEGTIYNIYMSLTYLKDENEYTYTFIF